MIPGFIFFGGIALTGLWYCLTPESRQERKARKEQWLPDDRLRRWR